MQVHQSVSSQDLQPDSWLHTLSTMSVWKISIVVLLTDLFVTSETKRKTKNCLRFNKKFQEVTPSWRGTLSGNRNANVFY